MSETVTHYWVGQDRELPGGSILRFSPISPFFTTEERARMVLARLKATHPDARLCQSETFLEITNGGQ